MWECAEIQQWKGKLLNLRTFISTDYNLPIFLNCVLSKSPLLLKIASSLLGLASWACHLRSHTEPCAQKSPMVGLTICVTNLRFIILEERGPAFSFCTRSRKIYGWSCSLSIFKAYFSLHSDGFNCSYKPGTLRELACWVSVFGKQLGFAVT